MRLKAITYNLRFGELASLEELAARIASEKPDMVALQEVDCHTRREGIPHQHGKDFATELGFRTGMFPLYGKTIAFAGGWYGIGLLTARPYLGVRKLMLPQASAQDQPAQDTPAEEAVDAPFRRRRANRKPADAPSEDE